MNSLDLYDFLESVSSPEDCTLDDFFDLTDLLRFFFKSTDDEGDVLRCRCLCKMEICCSCSSGSI